MAGADPATAQIINGTFDSGLTGGDGDGVCFLSLDHATDVTGGANMVVTVTLDNFVMYGAIHNSTASCVPPVSTEGSTWSSLKGTYR